MSTSHSDSVGGGLEYDPPGITHPENVDALTHQQIQDAFDTVVNSTDEVLTNWAAARDLWRETTDTLSRTVRDAVDGNWTGDAAGIAASAVLDYSGAAAQLADLFEETARAVTNTADAAILTKAFMPSVVPVTVDQKLDPAEYDLQARDAEAAWAEARQLMRERYLLEYTDQDARLPTYPPVIGPLGPNSVSGSPQGSSGT